MATGDHDELFEQRGQLLRELVDIGDLRRGSLRTQYRKCGKPTAAALERAARPLLAADLVGPGYGEDPRPHDSCRCSNRRGLRSGNTSGFADWCASWSISGRICDVRWMRTAMPAKRGVSPRRSQAEVERLLSMDRNRSAAGCVADHGAGCRPQAQCRPLRPQGSAPALRVRRRGALRRPSAQDLHHRSRPPDAGARLVSLRQMPQRLQSARSHPRRGGHLPVAGMIGIAAARTKGSSALLRELAGLAVAPKTVERRRRT